MYIDRAVSERMLLKNALERFPFGTRDEDWLTACGERNWLVLTRDQRIRRRVLERMAIQ